MTIIIIIPRWICLNIVEFGFTQIAEIKWNKTRNSAQANTICALAAACFEFLAVVKVVFPFLELFHLNRDRRLANLDIVPIF